MPWATPSKRPESFCTGRVIAMRDRPHGRVDVIRDVDGTVGDEIYLVQLSIHAVDGSSGLVDHRENFFFQPLDERSKAPNGSAQIEKDEPEPETDDDEEHAERDPDDVEGTQVGERQRARC